MEAAGKKRQPEEAADEGMLGSCKFGRGALNDESSDPTQEDAAAEKFARGALKDESSDPTQEEAAEKWKLFYKEREELLREMGLTVRISPMTIEELRRKWGRKLRFIHNSPYSLPPPRTAPTAPVCSSDDKNKFDPIDANIDFKRNNPTNYDDCARYHSSKRRHDLEVEFTGAWYYGQQSGINANFQPLTKKVLKKQIRFLRNHFAKLALEYYNDRNKEAQFELVRGIKFFPFFGPPIDQCETEPAVFIEEWSHLNFKAKPINSDSSEKKLFFAELYNLCTDEEPMVIQCCIMDPKNSDEAACGICLGIRHPAGVALRASSHAYGFEKLELGSLNY